MTDLVVVAASVKPVGDARRGQGTSGAAITAGQPVYEDATDGFKLKPCIDSAAATANAVGIALNSAPGAGQNVEYIIEGVLDLGVTCASGTIFVVSGTAGGIAPSADIGDDDYITVLGVGRGDNTMTMQILASGQKTPSA